MEYLFLFLFLLSIIGLVVGLIKPQKLHLSSRKKAAAIFTVLSFAFLILIGVSAGPVEKQVTSPNEPVVVIEEIPQGEISEETQLDQPTTAKSTSTETATVVQKTALAQSAAPISTGYKVSSVVDGDTVKVTIDGKIETIRIIGLNTPETVDPRKPVECFGKEASSKAKELLSGKTVTLEVDSPQGDRDKYGRLLRYVILPDGRDFGKTMIAEGYAYEYTYNTPYKYQKIYKEAQLTAQSQQLGLWSPNTCSGKTASQAVSSGSPAVTNGKYYTSSASNATRYYPDTCNAWQSLSQSNLKSFNSLQELLKVYPSRTLADICK